MSSDTDILGIDSKIQHSFQERHNNIIELKSQVEKLEGYMSTELDHKIKCVLEKSYENLVKKIDVLENNQEYNFYMAQTAEILQDYKRLLSTPVKLNFVGKAVKNDKEKQKVIHSYLDIAKNYISIPEIETSLTLNSQDSNSSKKPKIQCDNCSNKKDFDIVEDDIYICLVCFSQQILPKHVSSYKDSDRININQKYSYDRRIHFRDSINQYMGKQNSTVEDKVYQDLEKEFENHYLLDEDKFSDKKQRFKRITKEHVMIFLKDLGYTKHYENINLIHYTITGKKPDDISHLEEILMHDFDQLTELYDKMFKNIDRKNFINTQYILSALLLRHKHPCKKEDFSILKTIDRRNFHDEITKTLFQHLGWNFTSSF
jgi:ribosomal protein S24E